jgi:secreted PhoX family phosphatase
MSSQYDDSVSNSSTNAHFSDVIEVAMQRRRFLQGSLGVTALGFFGTTALAEASDAVAFGLPHAPHASSAPSFEPITAAFADEVRVPTGYSAQVLYSWGDPTGVKGKLPAFQ